MWLIDWYPIQRPRRPPIAQKNLVDTIIHILISFTHGIEFGAKCPRRWNMFPQEKISRTLSKNVTKAHPFSKFGKRSQDPKIPHLTTSLNLAVGNQGNCNVEGQLFLPAISYLGETASDRNVKLLSWRSMDFVLRQASTKTQRIYEDREVSQGVLSRCEAVLSPQSSVLSPQSSQF